VNLIMPVQDYTPLPYADISESTLVGRSIDGNQEAFEALVARYQGPLLNFIGRCLGDYEQAHDVLQHVFLQLYRFMPALAPSLSTRTSRMPLKAWLFRVATNRCIEEMRKQRPIRFSEMDIKINDGEEELSLADMIPDQHPLPEEIVEERDLQCTLKRAIDDLPTTFRSVVILRYTEDLSFVEIGRRLNMPENTAKTYFHRARPLLRAALAGQESRALSRRKRQKQAYRRKTELN